MVGLWSVLLGKKLFNSEKPERWSVDIVYGQVLLYNFLGLGIQKFVVYCLATIE